LGLKVMCRANLLVQIPRNLWSIYELPLTYWVRKVHRLCVQDWLGFGTVSKGAMWMLFVAFAASAMQVGMGTAQASSFGPVRDMHTW